MSRDRGDNVNTQLKTTNQWSRLRRQVRRHPEFSEDEVRLAKIHRADIQKNLATTKDTKSSKGLKMHLEKFVESYLRAHLGCDGREETLPGCLTGSPDAGHR